MRELPKSTSSAPVAEMGDGGGVETKLRPHQLQTSTSSKSIVKSIISKINNINHDGITDYDVDTVPLVSPKPASTSAAASSSSLKCCVAKPKTYHKSLIKAQSIDDREKNPDNELSSTDDDGADGGGNNGSTTVAAVRRQKKPNDYRNNGSNGSMSFKKEKQQLHGNGTTEEEEDDGFDMSSDEDEDDVDDSLESTLDSSSSEEHGIRGPLEPISEEQSLRKEKPEIAEDDNDDNGNLPIFSF